MSGILSGSYRAKNTLIANEYDIVEGVDGRDYLFFWGGFLSQWHASPFTIGVVTYNCAEQYMMAEKARLFSDAEILKKIMTTRDPSVQKKLGRQVHNFNQEEWEAIARDVVYAANVAKFTQNKDLRQKLLDTGDAVLVEASPYDAVWGVKMYLDNPDILDPSKWQGKNWLGEVCVRVRNDIRKEI